MFSITDRQYEHTLFELTMTTHYSNIYKKLFKETLPFNDKEGADATFNMEDQDHKIAQFDAQIQLQKDAVCKKALKLAKQAIRQKPNLSDRNGIGKSKKRSPTWEYHLRNLQHVSTLNAKLSPVAKRRFHQLTYFYRKALEEQTTTDLKNQRLN